MKLGIDDEVLMGMGIESVQIQEGNFEILTPGAKVTLLADGTLNIQQQPVSLYLLGVSGLEVSFKSEFHMLLRRKN